MKTKHDFLNKILITISFGLLLNFSSLAQLNGFFLKPSGDTEDYMKYIRKWVIYNNTNYYTGYLTLSAYKNVSTGVLSNPDEPVQKLQLQGGNILLTRTQSAPNGPNLNPTSRNGAILFGDNISTAYDFIHGKWGIEYDDQYSTGGLNIFKPKSSLTATRINFNLFIGNDGNVGIGTGTPSTKLHVAGNATIGGDAIITNLANKEQMLVASDRDGKLINVSPNPIGDNMGNCEATKNILLGNYLITGAAKKGILYSPSGEPWLEGLKFSENQSGEMRLSSFTNSNFILQSLLTSNSGSNDGNAIYWATNTRCGGYGFGLTGRGKIGGIFYDFNGPLPIMTFDAEKIGIGCLPGTEKYRLYVKDGIVSEEVLVKLSTNGVWPDYVFDAEYKLNDLSVVENYIQENNHLPDVPSAEEVAANGIKLGQMNALLLKKIEELTLYAIQQQKQLDVLREEVGQLHKTISK